MKIVAVDPGKVTGICILITNKDNTNFVVNWVGEMRWDERFQVARALVAGTWPQRAVDPVAGPPDVIVIERFRLRQGKAYVQAGSDFPSIQVQAIIETFVWDWNRKRTLPPKLLLDGESDGLTKVVFQEPNIMSRTQMRDEDNYLLQGSEHIKDAYKHARYYFITKVRINHDHWTT